MLELVHDNYNIIILNFLLCYQFCPHIFFIRLPFLIRVTGLEPARPFGHMGLNHMRLPVSPHPLFIYILIPYLVQYIKNKKAKKIKKLKIEGNYTLKGIINLPIKTLNPLIKIKTRCRRT